MEVGYRSLFLEESPSFGLYHYHLKGFKRTPVDYYTYPILKSLEKSPLRHTIGEIMIPMLLEAQLGLLRYAS